MSNSCPNCGALLERVPRSFIGRLFFRRIRQCPKCHQTVRERRIPFEDAFRFIFSRWTRCIRCGGYRVQRIRQRDMIDRMSFHPLSRLMAVTFAPIYHCHLCRLQYRDWRGLHPDVAANAAQQAALHAVHAARPVTGPASTERVTS
jgi:uncharacterized protein with PIN domain